MTVLVNNFEQIEATLAFKKNTFYKFMIIVRNKDGRTPLIAKEAPSGETTIKQWYVDSEEYYNKVKPEMIALADVTRGRLYMCIERKSTYRMLMLLLDKINAIIKEALMSPNASPKRLNKIVNGITSEKLCTDKDCKTWMYDIDDADESGNIRSALREYLENECSVNPDKICVMKSVSGWHVITPRKHEIKEDWHNKVADMVISKSAKLTVEGATDIIHVVEDIKVQPNQLCLAYFNNGE